MPRPRLAILLVALNVGLLIVAGGVVALLAALDQLAQRLVLVAGLTILLAAALNLAVGRRLARPLLGLTDAAERMGRGDLSTPVAAAPGAEIGTLAATLEEMRRRLLRLTNDLQRERSESQAILSGIVEGVYAVDRERRIRYLNPQAAALLGVNAEEAIGQFCGNVLNPQGPDQVRPCEEHCPIVHARFRAGASATEHLLLRHGARRTVVITSAPPSENRQVQVIRDETEVEATRRLRDAVLANISHEFRTPLSAQLASIELLLDQLPDLSTEQIGTLILSLQRGTLRLTQLIDNLLESVRIEAGEHAIRRQPVLLDEVIEQALEFTQPLLAQREQEVEVELPYPMPAISGDATRLTQVFVRQPAGKREQVRAGRLDDPHRWRGRADHHPRVGRGSRPRHPAAGRAVALHALRALDGRRAGAGRRRAGAVDREIDRRAPRRARRGLQRCDWHAHARDFAARGSVVKILAVDDDRELLNLISFALRQSGYLVIEASNGDAALSAFEGEQPDLVILDVNLPGLSGFDVCRRMREQASTPIMMLTVRSSEEDEVKGLDLGADDYLTKPFSPRTLLARVRALLRRADAERPTPALGAGDVMLNVEVQAVSVRGGAPVRLTNLEFRLLQYLLANAGHTLSVDRLTSHVWGYRGAGDRQLLKQLVHRLRQKIERDPAEPEYIITVPGIGYMLQATLQEP